MSKETLSIALTHRSQQISPLYIELWRPDFQPARHRPYSLNKELQTELPLYKWNPSVHIDGKRQSHFKDAESVQWFQGWVSYSLNLILDTERRCNFGVSSLQMNHTSIYVCLQSWAAVYVCTSVWMYKHMCVYIYMHMLKVCNIISQFWALNKSWCPEVLATLEAEAQKPLAHYLRLCVPGCFIGGLNLTNPLPNLSVQNVPKCWANLSTYEWGFECHLPSLGNLSR